VSFTIAQLMERVRERSYSCRQAGPLPPRNGPSDVRRRRTASDSVLLSREGGQPGRGVTAVRAGAGRAHLEHLAQLVAAVDARLQRLKGQRTRRTAG
jgi:hypothetical protein